jgi:hypothetical protein
MGNLQKLHSTKAPKYMQEMEVEIGSTYYSYLQSHPGFGP